MTFHSTLIISDIALAAPSFPASRINNRQRVEDTPSHPGGMSEPAKKRLDEYRKQRDKQNGICRSILIYVCRRLLLDKEGILVDEPRKAVPGGLGDFQKRSNRDRGWGGKRDYDRNGGTNGWDSTPRTQRSIIRDEGPSVRIPNSGWESTPRHGSGLNSNTNGWGGAPNRRWDAPTPRVARGDSPEGDGAIGLDAREWEEEQVRLDRDWYMGAEEGMVAGDEEHNPLSAYEDLDQLKQAEIATKQVKKISARQAQYVCHVL